MELLIFILVHAINLSALQKRMHADELKRYKEGVEMFKNETLAICVAAIILTGCATSPHPGLPRSAGITASDASRANPNYAGHYAECSRYAEGAQGDVAGSALAGAAAGAGVSTLMGLAMGLKGGHARRAGVWGLAGGLTAGGTRAATNSIRYRDVMIECLRMRGYEVY